MNNVPLAVIGYQCIEVERDKKGVGKERPFGRRFNVKAAAIDLAEMARKAGKEVYVRDVMGPAQL